MQPIPNCLGRYRRIRGYSQEDVAFIMGMKNAVSISHWENGLTVPSMRNAFKRALLYRILPYALYTDLLDSLKGEIQKGEDALAQKKKHHA